MALLLTALSALVQAQPSGPPAGAAAPASPPCTRNCAELPPGVDFSPPPVPGFMLQRPSQPLSLDEMVEQARQAAERSRRPVAPVQPAPSPSLK